ncbi:hypothetical protein Hypma_014897 [Hypsizygus marmoreus]|uniref:Uncharacterized protein n=1 Tax=Hypsizygus marmoreus TaxID=39966 RepID=A0A369K3M7_HYPMA|nr:hypothetical protein Hypma_014897 [Hypsizygus marmoreus]
MSHPQSPEEEKEKPHSIITAIGTSYALAETKTGRPPILSKNRGKWNLVLGAMQKICFPATMWISSREY